MNEIRSAHGVPTVLKLPEGPSWVYEVKLDGSGTTNIWD
jgi:hypothetical protein